MYFLKPIFIIIIITTCNIVYSQNDILTADSVYNKAVNYQQKGKDWEEQGNLEQAISFYLETLSELEEIARLWPTWKNSEIGNLHKESLGLLQNAVALYNDTDCLQQKKYLLKADKFREQAQQEIDEQNWMKAKSNSLEELECITILLLCWQNWNIDLLTKRKLDCEERLLIIDGKIQNKVVDNISSIVNVKDNKELINRILTLEEQIQKNNFDILNVIRERDLLKKQMIDFAATCLENKIISDIEKIETSRKQVITISHQYVESLKHNEQLLNKIKQLEERLATVEAQTYSNPRSVNRLNYELTVTKALLLKEVERNNFLQNRLTLSMGLIQEASKNNKSGLVAEYYWEVERLKQENQKLKNENTTSQRSRSLKIIDDEVIFENAELQKKLSDSEKEKIELQKQLDQKNIENQKLLKQIGELLK